MKKTTFALAILLGIASTAFSQADTLSTNIYQQNGKLGIGTSTPKVGLNIVDRIDPSGDRALIRVKNLDDSNRSSVSIALESFDETTGTALTHTSSSYTAIPDFNDMGTISTNGNGFSIYSTSDYGSIRFYTNREDSNILERMRIDALGKVGIGTNLPGYKLDVKGDINFTGSLMQNGQELSLTSPWIQPNPLSCYFDGNVGIGTSSPKVRLNIVDRIDPSGDRALIRVKNLDDSNRSSVSIALESFDETTGTALTHTSSSYTAIPDFNDMGTISTNGNGFSIYSTSDYGSIRFYTNREGSNILERMRIDALGKVGIGTGEPQAKLEVAEGDIYISDIEKGIIMKSPDGQCWRGVLDNSGSLIFTQVPCPGEEEIPSKVSEQWSSSLNIYPNPSDALITIELNDHFPMSTEYKIYGINGNLIDGGNIHSSKQDISVSGLEKGTYVLAILNDLGNRMDSQKLIVK